MFVYDGKCEKIRWKNYWEGQNKKSCQPQSASISGFNEMIANNQPMLHWPELLFCAVAIISQRMQ